MFTYLSSAGDYYVLGHAYVLRRKPLLFIYPPLFQPKFRGCSRCSRSILLGCAETRKPRLISQKIIFEIFQPIWPRYIGVTDRRTNRQTTCRSNIALCVASRGKNGEDKRHRQDFVSKNDTDYLRSVSHSSSVLMLRLQGTVFPQLYALLTVSLVLGLSSRLFVPETFVAGPLSAPLIP